MEDLFRHPIFDSPTGAGGPATTPRSPVPLSMIDVVFLLLTFLLLGQFPLSEGLLSMPLAGQTAEPAKRPSQTLWVQVTRQNGQFSYRLNDWPASTSADEVVAHIRSFVRASGSDEVAVVIGTEPGVPFERLVALWEACRAMGIKQLAMPASPDPQFQQPTTRPQ